VPLWHGTGVGCAGSGMRPSPPATCKPLRVWPNRPELPRLSRTHFRHCQPSVLAKLAFLVLGNVEAAAMTTTMSAALLACCSRMDGVACGGGVGPECCLPGLVALPGTS
jgi:hypothetical protein